MSKSTPKPPDCGGGPTPGTPPPEGPAAGVGGGPAPGAGAGAGAPVPCPDSTRDVSNPVTETISHGSPASWNGTYGWDSKYQLKISHCVATVTVRLKVTGTISAAQKAAWKTAIENKWNNKVYFCCSGCNCTKGVACVISVQYVDSGEDYEVKAQDPGADEGGRAGLGGTTGMKGWGKDDTVDVTHEFGHMLGNAEEYFTTNGVDYSEGGTKQPTRDPSGGIMNNPANNPLPRNYDSIRSEVEKSLGGGASCSTRALGT